MVNKLGGARPKDWTCVLENNKPYYINYRTGAKFPLFINKKGRPSFRDDKQQVRPAKCAAEETDIVNMLKEENTVTRGVKAKSKTIKHNSMDGNLKQYIQKLENDESLPDNEEVKLLKQFCKSATRKNLSGMLPTPKGSTIKAKTHTKMPRAKSPTPPRAKSPTPPRAKSPTPPRAKSPTPVVQANTISPVKSPTSPVAVESPKQRCGVNSKGNKIRCKKGTRCNALTGYCVKTGKKGSVKKKTVKLKTKPVKRLQIDKNLSLRGKNSKLDVMQVKQEYKELGLKSTDFFEDVCLVLKNIRNKLQTNNDPRTKDAWGSSKLYELHSIAPFVTDKKGKMLTGDTVIGKQLFLGPLLIRANSLIGEGGFGKIYGGEITDEANPNNNKKCAIKQSLEPMKSNDDVVDYYTEVIIQNELFCHAHRKALNRVNFAKIPKPLFMAKLYRTPLLGMESLDDSLYKFISKEKWKPNMDELATREYQYKMTKVITDMFECICNTLIVLQENYEFYHRDMHAGNIMYRRQGDSFQWFLIDFGFATLKMNNYRFNHKGAGPYGKFNSQVIKEGKGKGRVGHDLRLTLLFIFSLVASEFKQMLLPTAYETLLTIFQSIKSDIINNNIGSSRNFWHRGYEDAFNKLVTKETEPKVFLAKTIPELRQTLLVAKNVLALKGKATKQKTPSKTKKEFVRVERKEGKLKTRSKKRSP